LYQGFVDDENQITCYTDHQIFERYHKFSIKTAIRKTEYHFKRIDNTFGWDYVTTTGGRFGGLQKIQVEGKTQEAIKLVYADNDIVYVSIHSLHKISNTEKTERLPKFTNWGRMLGRF
jgi:transcription-repair coupling factor (superfamily II helicase)